MAASKFDLPIVDHHAHLRPGPLGIASAQAFARLGGTHLFLATQNYLSRPPTSLEDYRQQFATTEALAQEVERQTGIRVFVVLAPYPIDLVHVAPSIGIPKGEELQLAALELAAHEVREHRAVALGEVGRAHFPVDPPVQEALDRVMEAALASAKEAGCPAVLHTGDLSAEGYREVAEMVRKVGLAPERAIKHYAKNYVPPPERSGLTPSFLAKRDLVKEVLKDPGPWFLETDFLDDPARPGVALPLETVPKRVQALVARDPGSAGPGGEVYQALGIPFSVAPRRVYGLELVRERPFVVGGSA